MISGVLAVHSTETEFVDRRNEYPLPENDIPAPGPMLRPREIAVEASASHTDRVGRGRCSIQVTGTGQASPALAIVLLDEHNLARLAAKPLVAGQLPQTVSFSNIRAGRHEARLTRLVDNARTCYIARAVVPVAADTTSAPVELTFAPRTLQVRLVIPTTGRGGAATEGAADVPILLRRRDDPDWRYRDPDHAQGPDGVVTTGRDGRALFQDLGDAVYTLSMPGFEPDPPQRDRLTFRLTEFDQDRPVPVRPR